MKLVCTCHLLPFNCKLLPLLLHAIDGFLQYKAAEPANINSNKLTAAVNLTVSI
jgi:hypothetical protein